MPSTAQQNPRPLSRRITFISPGAGGVKMLSDFAAERAFARGGFLFRFFATEGR